MASYEYMRSMTHILSPVVHGLFDPATWTVTYVVYEKKGGACAIIDSVLDYDPKSGRTSTESADKVIAFVADTDHMQLIAAAPEMLSILKRIADAPADETLDVAILDAMNIVDSLK